jgi:hypothetical protein
MLGASCGGYRLHRQIWIDDVFPRLPEKQEDAEVDIEAIDVVGEQLWICGSHCRVRRRVGKTGDNRVDARLRSRKSRRLLGAAKLAPRLDDLDGPEQRLPFLSLLEVLATNKYLKPFLALPSKENGIDIEGLVVTGSSLLLGLRGPLVDNIAIVVELTLQAQASEYTHFLDWTASQYAT